MTDSIWEIIASTPWWVYVLFIFLLRVSLLAAKPHIISIKQLFILPILFLVFSLIGMFNMPLSALNFALWAVAISLGIPLGWLHFRLLKIKAIKNQAKLYMPGSWNVLIIILIIFAIKYYYNYQLALDINLLTNPNIAAGLVLLYGFFIGLFIGRMKYALRCLQTGPYYVVEESSIKLSAS